MVDGVIVHFIGKDKKTNFSLSESQVSEAKEKIRNMVNNCKFKEKQINTITTYINLFNKITNKKHENFCKRHTRRLVEYHKIMKGALKNEK